MNKLMKQVKRFWKEEEGIGTLEIVLILAVVIVLALIFKDWIIGLANKLMGKADTQANTIFDENQRASAH